MVGESFESILRSAANGLDWLEELVLGEFDESRPLSVVVATMLLAFVPGVILVLCARDVVALVVRLAKHPEKRDEVGEWMLLVAYAIPLLLPVLAAAAGATAAGVGSVAGLIVGSEAGAVLRAICLLLIEKGAYTLNEVVAFLRTFVKGDILLVLRNVKFMSYQRAFSKFIDGFIGGMIRSVARARALLEKLPGSAFLKDAIQRLQAWQDAFYQVQKAALTAVPKAMAELDARL